MTVPLGFSAVHDVLVYNWEHIQQLWKPRVCGDMSAFLLLLWGATLMTLMLWLQC
jgi:hypothetical protein